jgi:F0F1-type ATP synthase assembly protein I
VVLLSCSLSVHWSSLAPGFDASVLRTVETIIGSFDILIPVCYFAWRLTRHENENEDDDVTPGSWFDTPARDFSWE